MSSYALTLMCIFYCQVRPMGSLVPCVNIAPLVLDQLDEVPDELFLMQYENDECLMRPVQLQDLLLEFFEFLLFASTIDEIYVASIKEGRFIEDSIGGDFKNRVYRIEDPVTVDNNAACKLMKNQMQQVEFMLHVKDTIRRLKQNQYESAFLLNMN